jgi:paraquat-inducible protein A
MTEDSLDVLSECQDCGFVQVLPETPSAAIVLCARCGARVRQIRPNSVFLCAACSLVGLLLFALALFLPTASVWTQGGRFTTSDLLTGPKRLEQTGAWELAIAVAATLLVLPLAKLATVLMMAVGVAVERVPRWLRRCFAALPAMSDWAMVEVFLLGAVIALVRLRGWLMVSFGPALLALGGAALCSIGIDAAFDRGAFWRSVPLSVDPNARSPGAPWVGCHGCGLVERNPKEGSPCRRCVRPVHTRKPNSVARTWALIASAALLAVPANVLPVMTITKLGRGGPSTIFGGTIELTQAGFWGLALLVFVASILVPLVKLASLSLLLIMTARRSRAQLANRTRLYRFVALIGRWSMMDIFATMTLVELARFGWLGNVRPNPGASAFCAVVVLTLLASQSFDPRLMWDAAGQNSALASASGVDQRVRS